MKEDEWDIIGETGYSITIVENSEPVIAIISENLILYTNKGNYYQVVNGPIDLSWIENLTN